MLYNVEDLEKSRELSNVVNKYKIDSEVLKEIFSDLQDLLKSSALTKLVSVQAGQRLTFTATTNMLYTASPEVEKIGEVKQPLKMGFVYQPVKDLLSEGDCIVTVSESFISFESDGVSFSFQGELYSDWESVIPTTEEPIQIQKDRVISSLKSMNIYSKVMSSFQKNSEIQLSDGLAKLRLATLYIDIPTDENIRVSVSSNERSFLSRFLSGNGPVSFADTGKYCYLKKSCAELYIPHSHNTTTKIDGKFLKGLPKVSVAAIGIKDRLVELSKIYGNTIVVVSIYSGGVKVSLSEGNNKITTTTGNLEGETADSFSIHLNTLVAILNMTRGLFTLYINKDRSERLFFDEETKSRVISSVL